MSAAASGRAGRCWAVCHLEVVKGFFDAQRYGRVKKVIQETGFPNESTARQSPLDSLAAAGRAKPCQVRVTHGCPCRLAGAWR